jgi:hypothetical protein
MLLSQVRAGQPGLNTEPCGWQPSVPLAWLRPPRQLFIASLVGADGGGRAGSSTGPDPCGDDGSKGRALKGARSRPFGRVTRLGSRPVARAGNQRGVVAVEFALVVPVLILLVFGMIQFGTIYNDFISVRQGTRDAARQGAVANFGPTFTTGSPCNLSVATGSTPSPDIENLMCLAKSQIGLAGSDIRVDVIFAKPDFSAADSSWTVGDGLIVCTQAAMHTQTQLLAALIGSPFLKTKTAIRIEQPAVGAETAGYESPPSGSDWSWCTVSSSTP